MEMLSTKKRKQELCTDLLSAPRRLQRKAVAILAAGLLSLATSVSMCAQTLTTLHSFTSTDGSNPVGPPLVQATNGSHYGATVQGGANSNGTIFKITTSGVLTTLYNFCLQSGCTDGTAPESGPIQATNGNFYGTTRNGGTNNSCDARGCGTVYKMSPNGILITLYSFCSQSGCADGDEPYASLIQAIDGNFYGSTSAGGVGGLGTIFKITPSGTLTTLHSFDGSDGATPANTLIQGTDGNFYGVTDGYPSSFGTVFKVTQNGALTTLHTFNGADGDEPAGGLVQASDGNLYGTTFLGGASGEGTVFRITRGGTFTSLYSFCLQSACSDGIEPLSVVQATDGNLYGLTESGGANNAGTVFKIALSGTFTSLYGFCSRSTCADGNLPEAMVQNTNGNLYGTTFAGGTDTSCSFIGETGCGTFFRLSVGLKPFVETLPTSGKVGRAVKILGTNLISATSVTFNGTPATFTASNSAITTIVPSGATTGTVQVVTPHGTLSSNVPFRVLP